MDPQDPPESAPGSCVRCVTKSAVQQATKAGRGGLGTGLACFDRPLTVNHFRLLFYALCVMQKRAGSRIAVNYEQSTSSMGTARTEITRGAAPIAFSAGGG